MPRDPTDEPAVDDGDVGASVHDTGEAGEIGTVRDTDEEHVYVEPGEGREEDDEELEALGWRASDGSFAITTDAVEELPDDADGDLGVDLSAYEHPDDDPN